MSPTGSLQEADPPDPGQAERSARLAAILGRLSPEEAAWLRSRVTLQEPAPTRRERLDRRDEAILQAVAGTGLNATRAASELERDLNRYATTGWQRGEEPAEGRRALLHRILMLNDGRTLGWRQLVNVIGGNRGR